MATVKILVLWKEDVAKYFKTLYCLEMF